MNNKNNNANNQNINKNTTKNNSINNKPKTNNVEFAQDITLPQTDATVIEPTIVIPGYTGGIITRNLVEIGEEMLVDKDKLKK